MDVINQDAKRGREAEFKLGNQEEIKAKVGACLLVLYQHQGLPPGKIPMLPLRYAALSSACGGKGSAESTLTVPATPLSSLVLIATACSVGLTACVCRAPMQASQSS